MIRNVLGSMTESTDLKVALAGDARAFDRLVAPLRRQILAHCYRMLGSHYDAEEVTQEALLRAWRSLTSFEGRSSLRSWLYRIATNACLNEIESAKRRRRHFAPFEGAPAQRLPEGGADLEVDWLEPAPAAWLEDIPETSPDPEAALGEREATRIAFVAALQLLPARQRAVLLLRDVVGLSAEETAAALDMSIAATNSALQRSRASTNERARKRKSLDIGAESAVLDRYVTAWESGDLEALAALLKEDARYSMPPHAEWYAGRPAISAFFAFAWTAGGYRGFRVTRSSVNGQPAAVIYARKGEDERFRAHSVHVLDNDGDHVAEIVAFLGVRYFAMLGLPDLLVNDSIPR
jgi:RNA polymerase sigma-70 factor (ECF subfamily)